MIVVNLNFIWFYKLSFLVFGVGGEKFISALIVLFMLTNVI